MECVAYDYRNVCVMVPEGGKSNIKALADSVSSEDLLLGS